MAIRQIARGLIAMIALTAACAPSAYAPPARLSVLDSPVAPNPGGTDFQADLDRSGIVLGPDVVNGGARVRHALSPSVIVEGEAGIMHVTNSGTAAHRDGYTTRASVMVRTPDDDPVRGAVFAGIGGGYAPIAGGWAAADLGASLAGASRTIRPVFTFDLTASQPVAAHQFVVMDGSDVTTLELVRNAMARGTVGLELGPPQRSVVLGLSLARVFAASTGVIGVTGSDSDVYVSAGIGFRSAL